MGKDGNRMPYVRQCRHARIISERVNCRNNANGTREPVQMGEQLPGPSAPKELFDGQAGLIPGNCGRQIWAPLLIRAVAQPSLDRVIRSGVRPLGHGAQPHARLFRRAPTLTMVAAPAGAHEIFPAMSAATVARYDVVERQVVRLLAAVLAATLIPPEDLSAG